MNYGTLSNNLPGSPLQVDNSQPSSRDYDPERQDLHPGPSNHASVCQQEHHQAESLRSYGIHNLLSSSATAAQSWFQANIAVYMPATQVSHLAIRNEVLINSLTFAVKLILAMMSLHSALQNFYLSIQVNTPHNMNILGSSYHILFHLAPCN